ncbi:MAG: winged helix-turn-helix domain-containing protein [Methanothrix sp.]|nr:winged helix-turn-helix domain-containing protein [Methanothrix sp.]MCX8206800.1 winged helix-turn-helix domain-containing protein [Methanothrix sp.]
MPSRRSKVQIMSDILEICIDGANKTKIVYNANLNFKMLNSYLDALTKKGLLHVRKDQGNEYVTTEEGIRMLETCRSIYLELGQ